MIELSLDIPSDIKKDSSFPVSSKESLIGDSLLESKSFTEEPILESSSVLITPMVNSPKVKKKKQGTKKSKSSKNMIKSPILKRKEIKQSINLHNACENSDVLHEIIGPALNCTSIIDVPQEDSHFDDKHAVVVETEKVIRNEICSNSKKSVSDMSLLNDHQHIGCTFIFSFCFSPSLRKCLHLDSLGSLGKHFHSSCSSRQQQSLIWIVRRMAVFLNQIVVSFCVISVSMRGY